MLLCRDYGKVKTRRFEWAINLDDLMVALASKQVDDQLVMIDACRNADATDRTLSRGGGAGRSILTPDPPEDRDGTEAGQSLHFATSKYTPAWGAEDGVSLFSEALLHALSGGGAQVQRGWQVATGGLQEALTTYVRQAAAEAGVEQVPSRQRFADFVICKPRQLIVPVHVTCSPDSLWGGHMRLTVQGPGEAVHFAHDPANYRREWVLKLPKESYTFTVTFEGDEAYHGASARETVVPPLAPVHIELRRKENG